MDMKNFEDRAKKGNIDRALVCRGHKEKKYEENNKSNKKQKKRREEQINKWTKPGQEKKEIFLIRIKFKNLSRVFFCCWSPALIFSWKTICLARQARWKTRRTLLWQPKWMKKTLFLGDSSRTMEPDIWWTCFSAFGFFSVLFFFLSFSSLSVCENPMEGGLLSLLHQLTRLCMSSS